jgi:hypothetical protein
MGRHTGEKSERRALEKAQGGRIYVKTGSPAPAPAKRPGSLGIHVDALSKCQAARSLRRTKHRRPPRSEQAIAKRGLGPDSKQLVLEQKAEAWK